MKLKAIETEYKGYLFRSRLEARWAVFFDACKVSWDYEAEGFQLDNSQKYLPDFLLHDVISNHGIGGRSIITNLYVEVKATMTKTDAKKILTFSGLQNINGVQSVENSILLVERIPDGNTIRNIDEYFIDIGYNGFQDFRGGPFPFNFETIDGDYFVTHLGINKTGQFELFGNDSSYLADRDDEATLKAFKLARQARFEHGEIPSIMR